MRLRNEECKRDFLRLDAAQVQEFWREVGSLFSGSSCRWPGFAARGQELGQAHDVVGGHGEDESGADLGKAAHLHLRETADRLRPAEAFLDALAQPLADFRHMSREPPFHTPISSIATFVSTLWPKSVSYTGK